MPLIESYDILSIGLDVIIVILDFGPVPSRELVIS